ncbi:MAG: hypothetical protein QOF21_1997 [Actinomycetota bacterium]|jgi:uncharacterized protein (TIGR02569 family)
MQLVAAAPPPDDVRHAFGLVGEPKHLPGGISQTVWRVGDVVLKPVQEPNPGEGEWVADVLEAMEEDGFRVSKPVRAEDGRWLVGDWTAWRWIEGEHCRERWSDVVEAARAFHREVPEAVARVGRDPKPSWLEPRGHRWARAERTVWHGAPLPSVVNDGAFEWSLYERAVALGPPLTQNEEAACQVVHGDIAGNVLTAPKLPLAFIDVSPGWRTPASVDAQIVVEAVAWFDGDEALLDEIARPEAARAAAFRLLCGLQASENWAAEFPGEIENWTRMLGLIGA